MKILRGMPRHTLNTRVAIARAKFVAARQAYIRELALDGMSVQDISKKLGLAEATVRGSLPASTGRG